MSALPSKREFLNAHTNPATNAPYASLTRGRFSAVADAFAADNADKWAEPVKVEKPAVEKTVVQGGQKPAESAPAPAVGHPAGEPAKFDAKAVRAWAKQNGHSVGERGRIRPEVIAAFAKAGGKPVVPAAKDVRKPSPLDMLPRVRAQTVAWGVVPRKSSEGPWAQPFVLGVERCDKGHRISQCPCVEPRTTAQWGSVPLSLTKPVL